MYVALYERKRHQKSTASFKTVFSSPDYQALFEEDLQAKLHERYRLSALWQTFFKRLETDTVGHFDWVHPTTKTSYKVSGLCEGKYLIVHLTEGATQSVNSWQQTSLKELIALQQKIQSIAKMGTWEYHHIADKMYPNQGALNIFGFQKNTFDGRLDTVYAALHPEDRKPFNDQFLKAISHQQTYLEIHHRVVRANTKEVIYVVNRCEISYDESGQPLKTLGLIQDVTLTMKAQAKQTQTETYLRHIFEGVHDGLAILSIDLEVIMVNPWFKDFFGLGEVIAGRPCYDVFRGQEAPCQWCQQGAVLSQGKAQSFYVPHTNKEGQTFELLISLYPIKDDQDNITHLIESVRDVTLEKHQQTALENERRFQTLMAMLARNFLMQQYGDFDGAIMMALENLTNFFEVDRGYLFVYTDEGATITTTHEWVAKGVTQEKDRFDRVPLDQFPWWKKKLAKREPFIIEQVKELPDDAQAERDILEAQHIQSLMVIPIYKSERLFGFMGFDAVKTPHTWAHHHLEGLRMIGEIIGFAHEKKEAYENIEFLSHHDALTEVFNRRYVMTLMTRWEEKLSDVGIVIFDLNGLKLINDAYGHDIGDQILKHVASTLQALVREADVVARLGGDEFVVLMPHPTPKAITDLQQGFTQTMMCEPIKNITVSVAMGHAFRANDQQPLSDVLQLAENAMYQHKFAHQIDVKNDIIERVFDNFTSQYDYEQAHAQEVAMLMEVFAEVLKIAPELKPQYVEAAKYHDIGKVTIPEYILTKPDALNDEEYSMIQTHTESGYHLLRSAEAFVMIAEAALTHHERFDGSGYPRGLKGEAIPLVARMLSILEAYTVMTNHQPYAKSMSEEEALAEIKAQAGSQFDPALVEQFINDVLPKHKNKR